MNSSTGTSNPSWSKLEDGATPSSGFLLELMDLQICKEMLNNKFVAYGNIGNQSFYVIASTPEELDSKLSEKISLLYKKKQEENL